MKSKYVRYAVVLAAALPMGMAAQTHSSGSQPSYFADEPASDDLIYDNVKRKLAEDQVVKGGALDIDVKAGVVTLRGRLENQSQIDKATRLAKKVNGVKKVVNQIQLSAK
jgi:hyperosmotically inducible periplasmic protein